MTGFFSGAGRLFPESTRVVETQVLNFCLLDPIVWNVSFPREGSPTWGIDLRKE